MAVFPYCAGYCNWIHSGDPWCYHGHYFPSCRNERTRLHGQLNSSKTRYHFCSSVLTISCKYCVLCFFNMQGFFFQTVVWIAVACRSPSHGWGPHCAWCSTNPEQKMVPILLPLWWQVQGIYYFQEAWSIRRNYVMFWQVIQQPNFSLDQPDQKVVMFLEPY